jgi:hypothetical protein
VVRPDHVRQGENGVNVQAAKGKEIYNCPRLIRNKIKPISHGDNL